MSYPESVRYLYALGNELKPGARFSLDPMRILLAALGHPEQHGRFVHIAGTNGKGSTAAMIASVLQTAGFRTGLYTSPHLIEPTERIQVGGEAVSAAAFTEAFAYVHETAEALLQSGNLESHPSYFETVTAMALSIFHERTQISVIEVGLGGRLDATNVIVPELCVLTPISYDHEAFLGNTLESIAAEKAGILKPGVPAVSAHQHPVAEAVIRRRAADLGCELIYTDSARSTIAEVTEGGSNFELDGSSFHLALPGRHQIENATAAVLACRQLKIGDDVIDRGLRSVQWPGRLERISSHPNFILDGAHNPAGAAALAAYLREFYAGKKVWLVYGAMRDKAVEEVTEMLFPLAKRIILTSPDFPRALRPEAILEFATHPEVTLTDSVVQAIDRANGAPDDATVFFTGSLYLVGEVRKLLTGRKDPIS